VPWCAWSGRSRPAGGGMAYELMSLALGGNSVMSGLQGLYSPKEGREGDGERMRLENKDLRPLCIPRHLSRPYPTDNREPEAILCPQRNPATTSESA
jgi:hypothetical protein